jgi:hypothetical protein
MTPELLLRLYPRAWRERYGEELLALIEGQRPLGLGTWLDLLRGALVAHLHPLAADRDATRSSMMSAQPAIALRLTRWVPLVAVSVAAAIALINFDSGRGGGDWRIWLPPSLLQDLLRSPFSSISPTLGEAESLEYPRVLYFQTWNAETLNDLTLHLGMLVFAFAAALMWAVVARRLTSRSRPL